MTDTAGETAARVVRSAAEQRQAAWAELLEGRDEAGLARLESQYRRLEEVAASAPPDPELLAELARCQTALGHALYALGRAEAAVPQLRRAVERWQELPGAAETLGAARLHLAKALKHTGRLDEALAAAQAGLPLLADPRDQAAATGQVAKVLARLGHTEAAAARFDEALGLARRTGAAAVAGAILQHQGLLAQDGGESARAAALYREALEQFAAGGDPAGACRAANLAGALELAAGQLDAARACFERSHRLAETAGQRQAWGIAVQNLAVIHQREGEAAHRQGDEVAAAGCFEAAVVRYEQSLLVWQELRLENHAAGTHSRLLRLHLLLGRLDDAQEHGDRARQLAERLGLPESPGDAQLHALLAQLRGFGGR